MMRGGYVEVQLVPRSSDRAPSRSFFTWKVDLEAVHRRIAGGRRGPRPAGGQAGGGGWRGLKSPL